MGVGYSRKGGSETMTMIKCVWLKWIGGCYRCTHPSGGTYSSEFCGPSDRDDASAIGHDYCVDYVAEEMEE